MTSIGGARDAAELSTPPMTPMTPVGLAATP
jgi:hypothetical protein